jgi:predicted ATPase
MPEKTSPVFIRHITPKNLLSFGPDHKGIELKALNLLIGPNGCGKSNLIEAISLMRAAPKEFQAVTRKGGGVAEWIWKGAPKKNASMEWVVNNPKNTIPIRHAMSFRCSEQTFSLEDELIEDEPHSDKGSNNHFSYKKVCGQQGVFVGKKGKKQSTTTVEHYVDTVEPGLSILARLRDPDNYPELTWLAHNYEKIRIYRDWTFGRNALIRDPQKADMPNSVLEEDYSNLGLVLNRLKTRVPAAKKAILKGLKEIYDGIDDFNVLVEGGTVQVFFTEGDFTIPATRLSDGTLRYLCLLAILCDPNPPPLLCIEEPELGLHPDILPGVADLLKAASERTQLIVTTHSDILVDAMTETPEAVIVCEKHEGKTEMKRLTAPDLTDWLEKYRLGQLWTKGEIGGTRW